MATFASTLIDRLLRPLSRVRAGEGALAALMLLCVFLILTAYYVMKTAREGLILTGGTLGLRGDELKTYATGAMALLLLGIVPAYGMLANRARRIRLINISYAIVIGSLAAFFVLGRAGVPIGLAFFIWLGLVSVFLIAQFWSYANDIYNEEQGKRLFAIIATGGSLGAIFGPRIAKLADTFTLMLIAAGLVLACVALFNAIEHVHTGRASDTRAKEPISGAGGFALVLRDRYLLLIALLLLVANLVNTTGEYVLSNAARQHAMELVPATAHADLVGAARDAAITADRREIIKAFYSDFFMWVNVVGFLIQAFLVSRVLDKLGVRRALFVLPIIAFAAYGSIAFVGGLALVRIAKIAENGTDYSLQNTVRQALFLPTDRATKYKAKAAIDTFFVRTGDTLSAVLVGVGIHQLGFTARELVFVNMGLILLWLSIAYGIARHHRRISAAEPMPARRRPLGAVIAMMCIAIPAAAEPAKTDEPTAADVAGAPPPGNESGRVGSESEEEEESALRRVGQGALILPRVAVEVAFAPVRAGVWAYDRYQLQARFMQWFFDDSKTFGAFPTAELNSDYGLTVGGRFVHRNLFGASEHLTLQAVAGGRFRERYRAELRSGERFGRPRLELRGEFERRPHDAYYGVGNADDPLKTEYRQELARGAAVIDVRTFGNFHVRAAGALTELTFGRSAEGPAIDMMYGTMPGWDGVRHLYGELELRWDGRRRANELEPWIVPAAGSLVTGFAGRVRQLAAGDDYSRVGIDIQHFIRLGAGPRVIGARFYAEGVTGEATFAELPMLGGKYLLRGYSTDRFRDRFAALGSVQYSWDIARFLGASVFTDVGRVYPALRDISVSDLRVGYGIAIEAHSERAFISSASLSSSIDGGVFIHLAFDPVFDSPARVERR